MTNERKRKQNLFVLTATMALVVTMGSIGLVSISLPQQVYAQSSTSDTANHFGQSASQLAQGTLGCDTQPPGSLCGEQMGQHSASTQGGGDVPVGKRLGIGNVGSALCNGERLTPGQLADVLNFLASHPNEAPPCP